MSAQAPTVLERILSETRAEVQRRKRDAPLSAPDALGAPRATVRFEQALRAPGIGVIAEFKRRSPSAGALRERPRLERIVAGYVSGGAVAISILTEGPNFDGSLDDLRAARALCELPLLRKDFIVDPYQLLEARAAGADAVLLIVAALTDEELVELLEWSGELELDVLVEAHDRSELERALGAGARIVGINNRDLRDFSVDVERTELLMDAIPPEVVAVSESGISAAAQLRRLQARGVRAVLVGETLMRAEDPAAALADLRSFREADGEL